MLHTNRRQIITCRQKLILLGILNIINSINISTSAPLSSNRSQSSLEPTDLSFSSLPPSPSSSSSATLSSKKRTLDEGGNPSELAWQAWLLFDNEGASDAKSASDSANMVRRITPKSIFIAPPLPACPDGYESDVMNRCVKNVKIDQDAHIDFLLQRLNAMYANLGKLQPQPELSSSLSSSSSSSTSSSLSPSSPPSSSSSSPSTSSSSEGTGPFQFNIPLVFDTVQNDPLKIENIDAKELKKPFLTFPAASNKNNKNQPSVPHDEDTIMTVYEVKDTKKENGHEEKDEKIFFFENQNANGDNNDKSALINGEEPIPIVEFVEETNSNITDIIDYNIPIISMSQIQNRTALAHVHHDITDDKYLNDDRMVNGHNKRNESSISFTSVYLSTPSQLTRNDSNEHTVTNTENNQTESETEETIVNSPRNNITSFTPFEILFNDSETINESPEIDIPTNKTYVGDEDEETTYYTDEDVDDDDDTTDHIDEDFDTSTENNEEILKHSEAGISVTMPTINLETTILPANKNDDIIASTTSSMVTRNDDFIHKTTLRSLNNDKSVNISKDAATNDKNTLINSTNEEKIVIVTPKSQIVTKITFPPKEIVSIINLNNEENTKSSIISDKIITEFSEAQFEAQTSLPLTTQIDEISVKNSDVSPVVTIEEASAGGVIDRQPQTSLAEIFTMVPSNLSNDNESHVTTNVPDSSEIFTAFLTNVTKIVLPRDGLQEVFPLTPVIDETHSTKHIRASSAPGSAKIINNVQSFSSVNTDEQVYNYDAIFQRHPNRHTYKNDDNQQVIKTIDNQHFELNKNHNPRQNFFPHNFNPFFDSIPNYVKSPTYNRPGGFIPRTRPGYVRFPSDEANSIHTPNDLKEKFDNGPHSLSNDKETTRTGTGTLKRSNGRIPPGWRSDRQQPSPHRSKSNTNEQRQRNRSPMLMKFWTKMPLVKDPSLLYHPTYPTVVPVHTAKQHDDQHLHSLRMVNFYNEMSLFDRTRAFAQHSTIDN